MRNRRKWYSLLLVGLILILATSVMACGLPAPAPAPVPAPAPKLAPVPAQTLAPAPAPKTITPATTPTPSPKPTSPIGQTEQGIEDGWVRLKIQDVGSIDYPTDFLELQSQDYKDITKETSPSLTALVFRLGKSDFTLQQVGLNDLLPSSFNEYRRVMFKTVHLNPGEEVFRAKEKYTLSQKELAELKNELINELRRETEQLNTIGQDNKIIDSGSLEIVEINGMLPLVHTYKRQLNDNPVVLVKHYLFWNYDMVHHLILSFRLQDEDKSIDIYRKIVHSFRIQ